MVNLLYGIKVIVMYAYDLVKAKIHLVIAC